MSEIDRIIRAKESWFAALSGPIPQIPHDVKKRLVACSQAIDTLEARYSDMGYPIHAFRIPCQHGLTERVSAIERLTAIPIPQIVVEFWSIVGGVSFVDLNEYAHVDFWERQGIRGRLGFGDGVHIDTCDDAYVTYVEEWHSELVYRCTTGEDVEAFHYDFAPDGYHKDDISGGAPYGVLSDDAWAPTLIDFSWSGYQRPLSAFADPTDFLSYLRSSILECSGFPGFFGNEKFEPLRTRLVENLPAF